MHLLDLILLNPIPQRSDAAAYRSGAGGLKAIDFGLGLKLIWQLHDEGFLAKRTTKRQAARTLIPKSHPWPELAQKGKAIRKAADL